MKLKTYHQKRQFEHTPEPKGKISKSKNANLFVVQKHDARHLHYDFRLEIDGVLKSWAVPKGPSLDPKVKRLAVQVEDHPLEYGDFEGIIPRGHYGGGTVMLWDKGIWHKLKEDKKNIKHDVITFELQGKKLKGIWKLIRIKDDPKNWLLIKGQDEEAVSQEDYNIVEEQSLSVLSGRTMNEIAENRDIIWESSKKSKKSSKSKTEQQPNAKILKIKKSKLPTSVKPQLATLVEKPPVGKDWLHEMKFDGYRLLGMVKEKIQLLTRNGLDWTNHFEMIAAAIKKLKLIDTILDGEVVVLDEKGKPNFQMLQNAIKEKSNSTMVYYVFDIIYFQGRNISSLPLIERKSLLEKIIPKNDNIIRYSEHIVGDGQSVFENACELGFEGIISKKCYASYNQGRTKTWLKVKCCHQQEFVIGGYTKPKGNRSYFGALLLGYYDKGYFKYCGRVGTGFNDKSLKEVYILLDKYKTKDCFFSKKPPMQDFASWVKPKIVVEVEFTEITDDGILRHPSFKGIREDKELESITLEKKQHITKSSKSAIKVTKENNFDFEITHPDRIVYPVEKISKLDVAKFYFNIHQWILPYIAFRPLAIVRCPKGMDGNCFFQKHIVDSKKIKSVFESEKYLYIKDINGLMQLVQIGVLEFHPWGASVNNIEKPDMITFDLDPGEGIKWKQIVETAFMIKEELEKLKLTAFVKTTGGKGLHVVVPIQRRYGWEYVSHFAKTFSQYIVNKYPSDYVNVMSKYKRNRKIYIDYIRNQQGASAVSAYSTRAKDLPTVSTPLTWDELTPNIQSTDFTIKTVEIRLNKLASDPWQDFFLLKQKLPK